MEYVIILRYINIAMDVYNYIHYITIYFTFCLFYKI